MKLLMFSVFDCKAEAYMQPLFFKSKGEAIRAFQTAANDRGTSFCQHAEDYTLFHLGEFDELSGKFEIYPAKISLGTALEFKKPVLQPVQGV